MDPVALLPVKEPIPQTLQHALTLIGGVPALPSPILIKPNLCTDIDDTGAATTSVDIVAALLQLLLDQDSSRAIRIVESNSESKYADDAFTKLGYHDLVTEYQHHGFDVDLVNLSDPPLRNAPFTGVYFTNPPLHPLLLDAGSVISLAVPKTHSLTLITGVMKNLFGLLPRKGQSFYHPSINEVIVDLNRCITPHLSIVDARIGLEGVISGRPRRLDAIIVGTQPVSVDAVMSGIMGFDPTTIRHLVDAVEYDLGTLRPNVLGSDIASIQAQFATPANLRSTALISR